jgi:hypothetical protein
MIDEEVVLVRLAEAYATNDEPRVEELTLFIVKHPLLAAACLLSLMGMLKQEIEA